MAKTVVDVVAGGVGVTAPRRLLNRIALVVDKSSSIDDYGIREAVLKAVNTQLMAIKRNAYDMKQETTVSVYLFNNIVTRLFAFKDAWRLEPIDAEHYIPSGMTAIGNAVSTATDDLLRTSAPPDVDLAHLVFTITDGEHNSGSAINLEHHANLTYAFLVPTAGARQTLVSHGVPAGNIRLWEQNVRSTEEASRATSDAFASYYTARSKGAMRTASFYTDLSGVKPRDLARKLDDVTKQYRKLSVLREADIAAFVREQGIDYQPGRGLYELTKRERVQSHKAVVIEDKKTGKLYGGEEAKALVGITSGRGVTVAVTPGNHADYRIFVGSTSMNRKLVRGTTLLYER